MPEPEPLILPERSPEPWRKAPGPRPSVVDPGEHIWTMRGYLVLSLIGTGEGVFPRIAMPEILALVRYSAIWTPAFVHHCVIVLLSKQV